MDPRPLTYCGYPISPFALRRYGEPFLHSVLAQVQYCEHGDWCEECCFVYRGKTLVFNEHGLSAVKMYKGGGRYTGIRTFFEYMISGWIQKRCTVGSACANQLCCQLWHTKLGVRFPNTEALF